MLQPGDNIDNWMRNPYEKKLDLLWNWDRSCSDMEPEFSGNICYESKAL